MKRIATSSLMCLLLLGFISQPTLSGMSHTHFLVMQEGPDAILTSTDADVVAARVVRVSKGGTNGDPPRLQLEVLEVLRGSPTLDRSRSRWDPLPHDICYIGGTSEARLARWRTGPLPGPSVGETYVLAGVMEPDSLGYIFVISPIGRFKEEAGTRTWAKATIESRRLAEREPVPAQPDTTGAAD